MPRGVLVWLPLDGLGGAYGSAVLICLLVVCWLTAPPDAQDLCVLVEPEDVWPNF